ncbi:MAG: hypothetical protein ABIH70_09680 [Chloroflexota bacterium]
MDGTKVKASKRQWVISMIALVITLSVLVPLGIAHNAYPQGETYRTGRYIARDVGTDRPEFASRSSPATNPVWVRLFQDQRYFFSVVGIIGIIVFIVNFPPINKTFIKKVGV